MTIFPKRALILELVSDILLGSKSLGEVSLSLEDNIEQRMLRGST